MEKSLYFSEDFYHILFTIEVGFLILPYFGKKLKGNSKNFHLKKINYFFVSNLKFFAIPKKGI